MIKSQNDYTSAKKRVEGLFKLKVEVTENLGRNKFVSYLGTVTGVYPALFTIVPDAPRFSGKTSFSYSELLCGNVKLKKIAILK